METATKLPNQSVHYAMSESNNFYFDVRTVRNIKAIPGSFADGRRAILYVGECTYSHKVRICWRYFLDASWSIAEIPECFIPDGGVL